LALPRHRETADGLRLSVEEQSRSGHDFKDRV
jgi:hypothetical protein